MTRRILTAAVVVASTIAGLVLYACLYLCGREEQDEADELEVLHAIVDGRRADLPRGRKDEAYARLMTRREIVWPDKDGPYLTRAGWARIGRPLSDDECRCIIRIAYGKPHDLAGPNAIKALRQLEMRGLVDWPTEILSTGRILTPPGHAVLDKHPTRCAPTARALS